MEVPANVTRDMSTCAGCGAEVTVFRYREEDGWRCERCAPAKRACENQNQGCSYSDIDDKCIKHKWYFCQQGTTCNICKTYVSPGTLFAHYGSEHQDITCRTGSTWRATRGRGCRYWLVPSVAGTVVCMYVMLDIHFLLDVYIPVSSERLREFRCEVKVAHPTTGHTRTYTPDVGYNLFGDWNVQVERKEFPPWSHELDVIVNINQIE